jgi:hypothetical protein
MLPGQIAPAPGSTRQAMATRLSVKRYLPNVRLLYKTSIRVNLPRGYSLMTLSSQCLRRVLQVVVSPAGLEPGGVNAEVSAALHTLDRLLEGWITRIELPPPVASGIERVERRNKARGRISNDLEFRSAVNPPPARLEPARLNHSAVKTLRMRDI